MSVKKGEKGGRMEGEAGGWGWEGGMPIEVSMVGRGGREVGMCLICLGVLCLEVERGVIMEAFWMRAVGVSGKTRL